MLNKEKFYNQPYVSFEKKYNNFVPKNVFQTWYTKDLPTKMKESVELLKKQNPEFIHHLYDDNDCREFIKTHFRPDVLRAYDSLIPGAYKADLWRLCILFIKGGIYLDIKVGCINGFKLIELTNRNHFVKERSNRGIFNCVMVSQKGNFFLFKAIRQIVENVKYKFYGKSPLSPTGPEMLGMLMNRTKMKLNIDMTHYEKGGFVVYKNRFVLSTLYPEYFNERETLYNKINTQRYDKLWKSKNIYR
jgi:mannosyltransferase OCH1-like enzyme